MRDISTPQLGDATSGFVLAGIIAVLFNTVLACVKDASPRLLTMMNQIAIHNWITQGLADLILFFGLGLLFSRAGFAGRISANRQTSFLIAAVVLAGFGLFFWYLFF